MELVAFCVCWVCIFLGIIVLLYAVGGGVEGGVYIASCSLVAAVLLVIGIVGAVALQPQDRSTVAVQIGQTEDAAQYDGSQDSVKTVAFTPLEENTLAGTYVATLADGNRMSYTTDDRDFEVVYQTSGEQRIEETVVVEGGIFGSKSTKQTTRLYVTVGESDAAEGDASGSQTEQSKDSKVLVERLVDSKGVQSVAFAHTGLWPFTVDTYTVTDADGKVSSYSTDLSGFEAVTQQSGAPRIETYHVVKENPFGKQTEKTVVRLYVTVAG